MRWDILSILGKDAQSAVQEYQTANNVFQILNAHYVTLYITWPRLTHAQPALTLWTTAWTAQTLALNVIPALIIVTKCKITNVTHAPNGSATVPGAQVPLYVLCANLSIICSMMRHQVIPFVSFVKLQWKDVRPVSLRHGV